MKFIHPHFGIEIDTDSEKFIDRVNRLDNLYGELPPAKCMNCPGKCGVKADCCKVFSPPMNLIEFSNILKIIERDMTKEQQDELAVKCIDSFINPDYFKPCILLNENKCSVYSGRPLSCRLFGLYVKPEYERRVREIAKEIPEYVEIPFKEQCGGLEYEPGKKEVFSGHSDRIFKDIHKIDMEMFSPPFTEEDAKEIVMESCTYMVFEAHYLSVRIGPESLDLLAEMKRSLRRAKDAFMADKDNISNNLAFKKKEMQVKDFTDQIKKMIKDQGKDSDSLAVEISSE